jgi:hypothetical protein
MWPSFGNTTVFTRSDKSFHAASVVEHLQRFMAITSTDAIECRIAATECIGLVAETLGRDVAAQLLPPFLHAAAEGFRLDVCRLKEYSHGLFAVSAKVLKDGFAPYLPGVFGLACQTLEAVRTYSHLRTHPSGKPAFLPRKREHFIGILTESMKSMHFDPIQCLHLANSGT